MSFQQELVSIYGKFLEKYISLYNDKIIEKFSLPDNEKKELMQLWNSICHGDTVSKSYKNWSMTDLKKLCKERNIKVSLRKKQEYIDALEKFDHEKESTPVHHEEISPPDEETLDVPSETVSHETFVIHEEEEEPNSNLILQSVSTPLSTIDEMTNEIPISTISVNVNETSNTFVTFTETSDPIDEETEDFSKKSKEELYDLCKERNLKVSQRMKKKELLETLQSKEIVLTKLTKEELKKIAKDRNIKGLSGKSKEDLVQLLSPPSEDTKEMEHNEEQLNPLSEPIEFVQNIRQLEETSETTSIYDMNLEELQELCKSKGMKTFKRRRNELIEWLEMNNENEEFDQYLTDNENVL